MADEAPTLLAIETSCDETAAAALRGTGEILAEVVFSQIAQHAPHGGVVPEIASRSHLEALPALLAEITFRSGIRAGGFDAYAATVGPGLAPALLVGASAARGLAAGARKPFHPINHLEGHLLSPFFGQPKIPPHVALVVSGGHTLLFDVAGFRQYEALGRTLDDAAGEAFDKVAKMLDLGYPGGIAIERAAAGGDPAAIPFPRALLDSPTCDFSFSGLKTAVRTFLAKDRGATPTFDICASFQEAVVETLATKLLRATRARGRNLATLSGGVSSNSRLAAFAGRLLARNGISLQIAPSRLRTDNALMVAYVASLELAAGLEPAVTCDISPNYSPETFPSFAQRGT